MEGADRNIDENWHTDDFVHLAGEADVQEEDWSELEAADDQWQAIENQRAAAAQDMIGKILGDEYGIPWPGIWEYGHLDNHDRWTWTKYPEKKRVIEKLWSAEIGQKGYKGKPSWQDKASGKTPYTKEYKRDWIPKEEWIRQQEDKKRQRY